MNHSKSKNPWIAGLSSFAIHLVGLLVMAAITIHGSGVGNRPLIDSDLSTSNESVLESLEMESPQDESSGPFGPSSDQMDNAVLVSDSMPTLETAPGEISPTTEKFSDLLKQSLSESKSTSSAFVNFSLDGRSPKNRAETGRRNGATPASEAAVEAALEYLARHQRNNGSWTVRLEDGPCQGECDHGGPDKDPHEIAATGLALLCFLGAGHTMQDGEYSENVRRGVYFLIQSLKPPQSGRSSWLSMVAGAEMYEHGIATLALCEALQMQGDPELLRQPCQELVNFIVHAQHPGGGWDYHPNGTLGDLSIVGWQVMALKSAFSAKIVVNAETIRRIDLFLKNQVKGEFMFDYRQASKPYPSRTAMTAIGTLMRILRGWSRTDPAIIKAIDYLTKQGPSSMDLYYDYYATQTLFQFGGKPWKEWNSMMREHLINSQEIEGHMAGSWWFPGDAGNVANRIANEKGGRLYTTAMACLTLEVYYRYLPVYESVTDEFQF